MAAELTRRAEAEAAAERLRILAQPTRLMILSLLRGGERSVGEIEKALQLKQPGLSQQLGELRQAEMVATRRESKSVYYRLADERVELLVSVLERLIAQGSAQLADLVGPKPEPEPAPRRTVGQAAMFARVHGRPAR